MSQTKNHRKRPVDYHLRGKLERVRTELNNSVNMVQEHIPEIFTMKRKNKLPTTSENRRSSTINVRICFSILMTSPKSRIQIKISAGAVVMEFNLFFWFFTFNYRFSPPCFMPSPTTPESWNCFSREFSVSAAPFVAHEVSSLHAILSFFSDTLMSQ